jgi:hypothetical protein
MDPRRALVEQDVRGLEVAVDDAVLVRGVDAERDPTQELGGAARLPEDGAELHGGPLMQSMAM